MMGEWKKMTNDMVHADSIYKSRKLYDKECSRDEAPCYTVQIANYK